MGTKVKGFFKGLKNISNIFDEGEEEPEIQIGMPTDVKHVAHIGADGPATESPSWMNKFDEKKSQSGPLDTTSGQSNRTEKGTNNQRISRSEELTRDLPEKPKPRRNRRRSVDNMDSDSQSPTKKNTRRHRIQRNKNKGDESSKLPDIPRKNRRRKPKDDDGSTRSQDTMSSCSEAPSDI